MGWFTNPTKAAYDRVYNLPPLQDQPPDEVSTLDLGQIEAREYAGGLVKSFEPKAA